MVQIIGGERLALSESRLFGIERSKMSDRRASSVDALGKRVWAGAAHNRSLHIICYAFVPIKFVKRHG